MTTHPRLAFVGDWNASPHDRGRWSPSWLAARTGLRIHSAGPGRHGDIDYAMSQARAQLTQRHPPPGAPAGRSDHDVYLVQLGGLWLASWNMKYGRGGDRAALDLGQLLTAYAPDVLALQEAADYHAAIRAAARLHSYYVLASETPGRWHNVLLVRGDHKVAGARFVQLSPRGWRLVAGGQHAELWATSWLVDGWLRVVDVHLPPSVNWTAGRIHGPVMRVAAYVATMRKLRKWARTWQHRNR